MPLDMTTRPDMAFAEPEEDAPRQIDGGVVALWLSLSAIGWAAALAFVAVAVEVLS